MSDFNERVSSSISMISIRSLSISLNEFVWYYQGTNGWWKYDATNAALIEAAYKAYRNGEGPAKIQLPIVQNNYIIDFPSMHQYRVDNPHLRRKIIRDSSSLPNCKGVAGNRN